MQEPHIEHVAVLGTGSIGMAPNDEYEETVAGFVASFTGGSKTALTGAKSIISEKSGISLK